MMIDEVKCLKCKHFVDKDYIFKDYTNNININFGKIKDCKFRTDKSWKCNFEEVEQ